MSVLRFGRGSFCPLAPYGPAASGAGGPVCRPYGVSRSHPFFIVGAGPRPARRILERREGHTPGWLLSAFGRFTFSPSPTGFKKVFRNWVGEPLGAPAVDDSGQKVTLIRPLRGHLLPRRKKARAADSRPYGRYRNCLFFRRGRTLAGPQMYAARPGGRALQPSTSYHLLSKARRRYKIAVAIIFANPGPSGPAGI